MPRIPEETVEQVLAATDIVDLISSYGISLKRAGAVFKALCPFHNEKTASFTVNPGRQSYKCFGCGEGGSAVGFVMAHENLPFQDALRKLAQKANIEIEEAEYDPAADRRRRLQTRLKELHNGAARFLHKLLLEDPAAQHARDYLKSRGYGREMAERWLVGWMPENGNLFLNWAREAGFNGRELIDAGISGLRDENNPKSGLWVRFRDRLMFPIHNDYGDIIAFSGRQLREDPNSGKYINSPESPIFKKSNVFFGLDKARRHMAREKFAVLCEGQFDVIACHEAGVENTVASQGTAFTSEHARLLKRYTDKIVVCNDSDAAGHKSATRAFQEIAAMGMEVRVASLPAGDDPDSFIKSSGPEAFRTFLDEAAEFFDYLLSYTSQHENLNDPAIKARVVRDLAPLLVALTDKNAQEASLHFVATRLGLSPDGVRQAIVDAGKRRTFDRRTDSREDSVEPTALEPEVRSLAMLALQSSEVLDWLCDQTETLLTALESLQGATLLCHILAVRPEVNEVAAVNTFLEKLEKPDRLALSNLLDLPLPEEPLKHAEETLGKMTYQAIERRIGALTAQLDDPNRSDDEKVEILGEIADLQRMRNDAKNS